MKSETGRATRLAAGGGLALAALLLSAAPLMAQSGGTGVGVGVGVGTGTGTANSSSQSGSIAGSESNSVAASGTFGSGNSKVDASPTQSITFNSKTPSTQTIKNVPTVYAPGLAAAGSEVCLGSMSVGGAGAGFGLTIGGTMTDKECTLRLNAKTLAILGYTEAARETMCLDDNVRRAMLAAGTPCAQDRGARGVSAMASANSRDAQAARAMAANASAAATGGNCRKEFNFFKGWYDICD